jgi:LacI family transcriptional regulator
MKKTKVLRVSVRAIAKAAEVSSATVGYVLRNQAGPSEKTRQHVLKVAQQLGYVPDARINSWMAAVRGAKSKDFLPIAWLNTQPDEDAWEKFKYLSPYREGMRERCEELGYRLDEIWTRQPGMTAARLSKILFQRGIEGVVVTPPATHIRLNWKNLAAVTLGTELRAPHLHRIRTDAMFNLLLTLKMLKRFGYRRIGICLSQLFDQIYGHVVSALSYHYGSMTPESKVVPPLFYLADGKPWRPSPKGQILDWVRKHRPDVIVGHHFKLVQWAEEEGIAVPQKMGIVHLALDDDVLDWSGIYSNRRDIGRSAAELVISLVQNRQFGVPKIGLDTIIRGHWRNGRTLLVPKPK